MSIVRRHAAARAASRAGGCSTIRATLTPDRRRARYEPTAYATHTTANNISQLMNFYELTGEERFIWRASREASRLAGLGAAAAGAERARRTLPDLHRARHQPAAHRPPARLERRQRRLLCTTTIPQKPIVHYSPDARRSIVRLRSRRATRSFDRQTPQQVTANSPLRDRADFKLPRFFTTQNIEVSDLNSNAGSGAVTRPTPQTRSELVGSLNAEGYWPTPLTAMSHPYIGDGSPTPAPGDFSQTRVGDMTDTSPFIDEHPVTGISTGTFIQHMSALLLAVDRGAKPAARKQQGSQNPLQNCREPMANPVRGHYSGRRRGDDVADPKNDLGDRTVKLVSIVSIDIVGFSSMSEKDHRKAARHVESLRARIERCAHAHGGRVFNTAGDGFMLEFASAGQALGAITDILDKKGKGEPPLRVGAHVGDVVVTANNDLLGHGVNVAARLQALANPGTALVSAEFRSMAHSSPTASFLARGRQPLDNIEQKVQTFEIVSKRKAFARGAKQFGYGTLGVAILAGVVVFGGPPAITFVQEQMRSQAIASTSTVETTSPSEAAATVPAAPTFTPGQAMKDCPQCPDMVVVPGNIFTMGSPASEAGRRGDESPQHEVTIAPFAVSKNEITFAAMGCVPRRRRLRRLFATRSRLGPRQSPVIGVSWDDAQAYVNWLNEQAGEPRYRLLTESEWEYVARAGATTAYSTGARLRRADATFARATLRRCRHARSERIPICSICTATRPNGSRIATRRTIRSRRTTARRLTRLVAARASFVAAVTRTKRPCCAPPRAAVGR